MSMKQQLSLAVLVSALAATPSWGQVASQDKKMPVSQVEQQAIIVLQSEKQLRADNYLGASVLVETGEGSEEIGSIQDLIFDANDQITGAVVGVGGFLGIGEKSVALDWNALDRGRENGRIVFMTALTRDDLERASAFKTIEAQVAEKAREEALKQEQQTMQKQAPNLEAGSAEPVMRDSKSTAE